MTNFCLVKQNHPYMRRSPKIDEVIPLLYLRGLSNGDIYPALAELLGSAVSGLSAAKSSRLKASWERWHKLAGRNVIPLVLAGAIFVDGELKQAA